MTVDREAVRAWLEASCKAQGVPVLVADAGVIARVGVLLTRGVPRRGPRQGSGRGAPGQSLQVGTIRPGSTV